MTRLARASCLNPLESASGPDNAPPLVMLDASGGTQVLVVDDDVMVARGYGRLLRQQGVEVTIATSAEEAVGLMAGKAFDVVVSDIRMPGEDGIAMLRAVRSLDADLPVILMTGHPTIESATQAVALGAQMYLMKPLAERSLESAVESAAAGFLLARRRREALADSDRGVESRNALELGFTSAVNQLWMAYQPIVAWQAQKLFGFEALVRTADPAFPNPGVLLAAGEQLKQLDVLGRAIRTSVASSLTVTPSPGLAFVNLHPQDLFDDSLYAPLSPLSLFASRVVLEITERASIELIDDLKDRVDRLRTLGFRIAIDDLGAGYAGLTTIATLTPDIVKLDMGLVRGVETERTKRKLISSIICVCKDLDIHVIAEGIETPAERETLIDLGCDLFQGYLFGRPQRSLGAVRWAAPLVEAAAFGACV